MLFTLKKWLKKVCLFSASASLACFFGSPLANATAPAAGQKGVQAAGTSTISASTTNATVDVTLSSNLIFTGSAQDLISAVSATLNSNPITITGDNRGADLYLRVDTQAAHAPGSVEEWVLYTGAASGEGSLSDPKLQKINAGTYYVYYFLDGKNNLPDINGDSQ